MARDVYLYLGERWGHSSFINIVASEQSHMDAVGVLLDRYVIEDPITDDQPGTFVNADLQALYDSLTARGSVSLVEALQVGGLIEEVDISDLGNAITATAQADITAVYENLRLGSYNHLRAFANGLAQLGITYQAQYLDAETVAEILAAATGGHGPGRGVQ